MSEEMTQRDYWNEVTSIAESVTSETFDEFDKGTQREIMEDNQLDEFREMLQERLHETIDGHQWIIYTSYNYDVMRFSDNEGAAIEDMGSDVLVKDGSLNTALIAYCALEADVVNHGAFGMIEEEL